MPSTIDEDKLGDGREKSNLEENKQRNEAATFNVEGAIASKSFTTFNIKQGAYNKGTPNAQGYILYHTLTLQRHSLSWISSKTPAH